MTVKLQEPKVERMKVESKRISFRSAKNCPRVDLAEWNDNIKKGYQDIKIKTDF